MKGIITPYRIQKLHKLAAEADRITVVTHTRPDGDAVGSSIATARFIGEMYGRDVAMVIADAYSKSLDFILDEKDRACLFQYDTQPAEAAERILGSDLIICLDCNGIDRTGALKDILGRSSAPRILIDHHLTPHEEEFCLVFSETEISSASELAYWILLAMPEVDGDTSLIPMHCLRALMAGMTTDTNNFANSVFPSTLEMASRLLEAGVDRDGIIAELYNRYRENRLRMMGFALKDKMTILPEGTAYIILTASELERFDIEEGELEGLVNIPLGIDEVKMSILLKEDDGFFRVSVRSKKGISANSFATRFFNGGGHEQAAGGRLYFPGDISVSSDAEDYVRKVTGLFFTEK